MVLTIFAPVFFLLQKALFCGKGREANLSAVSAKFLYGEKFHSHRSQQNFSAVRNFALTADIFLSQRTFRCRIEMEKIL